MGFRRYLQFLSAFSRLVLILSGFTGSSFPDAAYCQLLYTGSISGNADSKLATATTPCHGPAATAVRVLDGRLRLDALKDFKP